MTKAVKATGIKTWPEDDRPSEKLLKKGAHVLSNSELLAILLRTGTQGTSAIDLARKIIKKFSTFRNMAHTDVVCKSGFTKRRMQYVIGNCF